MSIINLTSNKKYQLDEQSAKFLIKVPRNFFTPFNCYPNQESAAKRIRKLWKSIDIFIVETSQSYQTIKYEGSNIAIPNLSNSYNCIESLLNDKHTDRRVRYTRYFDGLDQYDNEAFDHSDAEMLQLGHESDKPFPKGFIPQGCSFGDDGYFVWCSADEYIIYYRGSKGASYKHQIFLFADRIMDAVRGVTAEYTALAIFEILKCKIQAIMDIDYVSCNRSGKTNYLLRTLQPAYFRLRENGISYAAAYYFIARNHPKHEEYADRCSVICYWLFGGDFSQLFRNNPDDLPRFITNWIMTKQNYACCTHKNDLKTYQRYYDNIVHWYNLAVNADPINQNHILRMSEVEDDMIHIFEDKINHNIENAMKERKLTPRDLKDYLDRYVIGQDKAKRVLSVAVYNHYKRIGMNQYRADDQQLAKSNVIMIGETGSGKTLLAKTIARYLDIPIFIQDCTKLTEAGYVGQDVEECLKGLLMAAGGDIQRAEQGIVILDEVDKLATRNSGVSITRDVSGAGVQQALLKIVEGDKVQVSQESGRRHPNAQCDIIDTTNILFIATGAFAGINSIIRKRCGSAEVGFCSHRNAIDKEADLTSLATAEDFRQFGMIPEFIGRFPTITNVNKLTEDDLVRILTEPADSIIRQYTEMLADDNTELLFTDDALQTIAHHSIASRTGARGLRGVIDNILGDIMFDAPSNKNEKEPVRIIVDSDYIMKKLSDDEIITWHKTPVM